MNSLSYIHRLHSANQLTSQPAKKPKKRILEYPTIKEGFIVRDSKEFNAGAIMKQKQTLDTR